jgi:hypothetical protein
VFFLNKASTIKALTKKYDIDVLQLEMDMVEESNQLKFFQMYG